MANSLNSFGYWFCSFKSGDILSVFLWVWESLWWSCGGDNSSLRLGEFRFDLTLQLFVPFVPLSSAKPIFRWPGTETWSRNLPDWSSGSGSMQKATLQMDVVSYGISVIVSHDRVFATGSFRKWPQPLPRHLDLGVCTSWWWPGRRGGIAEMCRGL